MENETQRLVHYLDLFEEIRGKVDSEEAAAAVLNQIGKDMRMQQMMTRGRSVVGSAGNGDQPATEKQRSFLRDLGAKNLPENLSREDASSMIDQLQAK